MVIFLSACGGGGGSSDGAGGNPGRVFSGSETFTLSAPGVPPDTSLIPITITISGNQITYSDGDLSGTATISADGMSFIVALEITIVDSIGRCNGEIVYTGTISGDSISGSGSGQIPCSFNTGQTATITARSTFTATETTAAKAIKGKTLTESLSGYVDTI